MHISRIGLQSGWEFVGKMPARLVLLNVQRVRDVLNVPIVRDVWLAALKDVLTNALLAALLAAPKALAALIVVLILV